MIEPCTIRKNLSQFFGFQVDGKECPWFFRFEYFIEVIALLWIFARNIFLFVGRPCSAEQGFIGIQSGEIYF